MIVHSDFCTFSVPYLVTNIVGDIDDKFVGESVPVIDSNSKKIIGIISENDVLSAYLNISEEINNIEKN